MGVPMKDWGGVSDPIPECGVMLAGSGLMGPFVQGIRLQEAFPHHRVRGKLPVTSEHVVSGQAMCAGTRGRESWGAPLQVDLGPRSPLALDEGDV